MPHEYRLCCYQKCNYYYCYIRWRSPVPFFLLPGKYQYLEQIWRNTDATIAEWGHPEHVSCLWDNNTMKPSSNAWRINRDKEKARSELEVGGSKGRRLNELRALSMNILVPVLLPKDQDGREWQQRSTVTSCPLWKAKRKKCFNLQEYRITHLAFSSLTYRLHIQLMYSVAKCGVQWPTISGCINERKIYAYRW